MRTPPLLMIAPAVAVIALLFAGGLGLAMAQSIAGFPVFKDPEVWASLGLTLRVATIATVLSAAAALLIALTLNTAGRQWPGLRSLLQSMLQVPIALPHLALGLAVVHMVAPSGWIARVLHAAGLLEAPSQFPELLNDRFGWSIILVYVLKEAPFLAVLCLAMLARIDPELYSAARTLGASEWQRLRAVTLPLVWPGLAAGSLVVFAFIVSAFEIPYLLGRPFPSMLGVVAQRKYLSSDLAERPEALAIAGAGAVIGVIVFLAAWRLQRFSPWRFPQP